MERDIFHHPSLPRAVTACTSTPLARSRHAVCPCCHNYLCSPGKSAGPRRSLALKDEEETKTPSLDSLGDDVLALIAKFSGQTLISFACVSRSMRACVRGQPALYQEAYLMMSPNFDTDGWGGDEMAPDLWRACLMRKEKK